MMTQQDVDRVQHCLTYRTYWLMRVHDISQTVLAGVVGVKQQTLSRWLSPKHQTMPNAAELAAIAGYLGTTTDYLVGLTEDPEEEDRRETDDLHR